MAIKIDLTGRRYGKLTVLELAEDIPNKKKKWLCRCDCGNEIIVSGSNLQSGQAKQCRKCIVSSSLNDYIVYMHIAPNGKRYIGVTHMEPYHRWRNGKGYDSNEYFDEAIKEFGWDNIQHIVVCESLTRKEAKRKEVELIKRYDTTNREKGYNISPGGDIVSEESRKKMSISQTGKKHTPEQIEKIRKALTGQKRTPEQIERANQRKYKKVDMYDLSGNYIKTFDTITQACEETGAKCENISKCFSGQRNSCAGYLWKLNHGEPEKHIQSNYRPKNKPVLALNKDGNIVKEFESTKEAERQLNLNAANISKCCKNKKWTAGGYYWRFKEE